MPGEVVTADMRDRNPGRLIVGALDTLIFGGDAHPPHRRRERRHRERRRRGADARARRCATRCSPIRATSSAVSLVDRRDHRAVLYIFVSRILHRARSGASPPTWSPTGRRPRTRASSSRPSKRDDEIGIARARARGDGDRHLLDAAPAPPPRRSRPRGRQDQPRPPQHADLGAAALRPGGRRSTIPRCSASRRASSPRSTRPSASPSRCSTTAARARRRRSRCPVGLRALVEDAAFDAGLAGHPDIAFDNGVPDGVDPQRRSATRWRRVLRQSAEERPRGARGRDPASRTSPPVARRLRRGRRDA